MTQRALICGISGQDGAYLANLLLGKGYEVFGSSRDAQMANFGGLEVLGIRDRVRLVSMSLMDFRSVLQTLAAVEPTEVYNLAGQSSVGLSFEQPVETLESIAIGTLNLLEVMRFMGRPIRLYNAASSECFGHTADIPADESTPFRPRSPYAVAKASAFWEVANYREAYGLWACSGILFNHESPLRPHRFVTRKIVSAAVRIAAGSADVLELGSLSVQRDWGWAPEYVEAMWLMLQQSAAEDFVIATGESHMLEDFVSEVFAQLDLDWRQYTQPNCGVRRPADIAVSRANPRKALAVLGWQATTKMKGVIHNMIEGERALLEAAIKAGHGRG